MRDMTIKEFYLKSYPSDDCGKKIKEDATFVGLLWELQSKGDVYDFIGIYNSIVRQRLFEELADQLQLSYTTIYRMWLDD